MVSCYRRNPRILRARAYVHRAGNRNGRFFNSISLKKKMYKNELENSLRAASLRRAETRTHRVTQCAVPLSMCGALWMRLAVAA